MSDVRTSRLGDRAEQRRCQAIIPKGFKGHTVTLTIHEDTQVRVIVDKTVESYREAETIARAFASQQGFPWHKVAISSFFARSRSRRHTPRSVTASPETLSWT